MEYKHAKSVIGKLVYQIKLLCAGIVSLLLCNAILGVLLWHQSDQRDIILVPSTLHRTARITQQGVDSGYLDAMAMMLINERLNITPKNVQGSNQALLQFIDPQYYAAFKRQLAVEANTIINGKIASSFYVNHLKADANALSVIVQGQLKRWVGERLIGREQKRYQLTFSKHSDLLLLTSFKEITPLTRNRG